MLEGIGGLPEAWLTELAHNSWWPGHRERARCGGASKTWEKCPSLRIKATRPGVLAVLGRVAAQASVRAEDYC